MPAMHFSSVDFPEPLWPSRPSVFPASISRSMFDNAHRSWCVVRPKWMSRSLSELYFSLDSRKRFERSHTSIAGATGYSSSAKLFSRRPNT